MLKELKDQIRRSLRRGSTLDSDIDFYIKRAVETIEKNHYLRYMDRFGRFEVKNSSLIKDEVGSFGTPEFWLAVHDARTIKLPSRLRALKTLKRIYTTDGEDREISILTRSTYAVTQSNQTHLQFLASAPSPTYDTYFLDGKRKILLNTINAETFPDTTTYVLAWEAFSDWSTDDDFEHPLLEDAQSLLVAMTMVEFAPRLSMPQSRHRQYQDKAALEMKVLLNADNDIRYSEPAQFNPDVYVGSGYQTPTPTIIIQPRQEVTL